ncbi:MAG: phosphoribosyltransferase family protein [Planctomycetota bacterium]|nr:phosphoribosyltransferase family protein [Planctomycetota bacterium]
MDQFRTLLSPDDLQRRIQELADQLAGRYPDAPCLVAVMEGARVFASHLVRRLPWQASVHEIRAKSYHGGTVSSGEVQILGGEGIPAAGRPVLLFEDIVDTGRTVARLREHFLAAGASEFVVASLLSKPSRRVVEVDIDFLGFEIPDEFVIGFGMDLDGKYRDLDRVAIFEESKTVEA